MGQGVHASYLQVPNESGSIVAKATHWLLQVMFTFARVICKCSLPLSILSDNYGYYIREKFNFIEWTVRFCLNFIV